MAAPTVTVTIDLSSMIGVAVADVEITAKLDRTEVYGGFIIAGTTTATTDETGVATMELFPNALPDADLPGLGTMGSTYRFTASATGGKKLDVLAVIPNQDCNLHSVFLPEDSTAPNPGLLQGSVRYDVVQALSSPQQAQARSNIGFAAGVLATALTGLSAASGGTITAADTVLQMAGKIEYRLANLEDGAISGPYTITANSASPTLTLVNNGAGLALSTAGGITAGQFTGPLTGNVTGNVSGNAGTATALATARAINGVNFDGTAAITVTAAAGTLTGTALASTVVSASINAITPTGGVLGVAGTTNAGYRIQSSGNVDARDWAAVANVEAYGDFAIKQSDALGGDPVAAGTTRVYITVGGQLQARAGLAVTGLSSSTVADNVYGQKVIGSTGRINLTPYVNGTVGAIIESVNAAENAGLPLTIGGSSVRINTANGLTLDVTATGAALSGIQTITADSSNAALTVTQDGGGYALIIPGVADQWYGLVGDLDGKHFRFSGTAGTGYALFQTFETGVGATGSFVFQRDGGRVLIGTGTDNGVDNLQVSGSISASTRFNLPSFTVATLPAPGAASGLIFVSDESGGAVPAFSDGTDWRRVTDRAVVS